MDVVLLFPGQGSQKPGMGKDVADTYPAARDAFERADAALGTPLSQLCFEGPADELTLLHNAQPALLTHGAAVWAAVRDVIGANVLAAAGHSLGELTAYHAAGSMTLEDAVRVVRRRGELMYQSGLERPGAMAAILGDTNRPIEEICAQASAEAGTVVPANLNCPGQLVISGEVAGVEKAMELCKAAGAKRAIRLNVSGAFHSPLMHVASTGLRDALADVSFGEAAFPVYSNVSACPAADADATRDLLVRQLTSPVRWTSVVEGLAAAYPEALFVEMGPGNVLAGLVKRIDKRIQVLNVSDQDGIEQIAAFLAG